ncbi:hypothetical protein MTO96_039081 [Rhipicephalus appendiculatus]
MAVRPRSAATPPTVAPKATLAKPQKDDSDSSPESEDDQTPKKVAKPETASAKKTEDCEPKASRHLRDSSRYRSPCQHIFKTRTFKPIKPFRHVLSYANVSKTIMC